VRSLPMRKRIKFLTFFFGGRKKKKKKKKPASVPHEGKGGSRSFRSGKCVIPKGGKKRKNSEFLVSQREKKKGDQTVHIGRQTIKGQPRGRDRGYLPLFPAIERRNGERTGISGKGDLPKTDLA